MVLELRTVRPVSLRFYLFYSALVLRLIIVFTLSLTSPGEDATLYDENGHHYAWAWSHETFYESGWDGGTDRYARYTGALYILIGRHPAIIMAINSLLGALGSFLIYSVLTAIAPQAHWFLRLATVADPSLLYWTSIHGKDPLVFFCLALALWAIHKRYVWRFLLAVAGIALIRPHIAFLCLAAGVFLVPGRKLRIFCFALMAIGSIGFVMLTFPRASNAPEVLIQLSAMISGLSTGGSALDIGEIESLTDLLKYLPLGIIAVLFRPFPWEPGTFSLHLAAIYQLIPSIAAIFILLNWRQTLPRTVKWVALYCIGFVLLFALISGNLGTLARQRIQFTPFLWIFVAWIRSAAPPWLRLLRPSSHLQPILR